MARKHMDKKTHNRSNTLLRINEWCYKRASYLSLSGEHQAAQALTEEHMEALKNIRPEKMLWLER